LFAALCTASSLLIMYCCAVLLLCCTVPYCPAANCLHPGVVATELVRYLLPEQESWWQQPLAKINRAFSLTAEQGAQVGDAFVSGACAWSY
jgi:NAD(P)-dependent dehydrogenase (short-subunit alcohol dehydrogenase family)